MAEEKDEYIDRTDIVIENDVASWQLKAEGAILGTYSGTFKFRCFLLPSQQVAAGRERRDLLGENAILANQDDQFYAYALTQLKYRVISGPPFWESSLQNSQYAGDIPDIDILGQILDAAVGAELKYKHQLSKRKEEALDRAKRAAEQILSQQKDSNESEAEKDSTKP